MKVTSIMATSGGAGASTVSIYVSKILSLMSKKVLIVDFNPNSETLKPITFPNQDNWLLKLNTDEFDLLECINKSKFEGVDVVSLLGLNSSSLYEKDKLISTSNFYELLTVQYKEKYDHVIFDCSACDSATTHQALKLSHQIIGIVESRIPSVSGIIPFLNKVAQARIGKPLSELKLILNKVEVRSNACKIGIKKYQNMLDKSVTTPFYLPIFDYTKNNGKFRLKLPINALKNIAFMLNESPAITAKSLDITHDEKPLKNHVNSIINEIYTGTASQRDYTTDSALSDDLAIDVFDEQKLHDSELSDSIEEFFSFIKQQKFGDAVVIVDEQGLVIAQDGEMNDYLNHLTVAFNQYAQLLEFAHLNDKDNGLWIKTDNYYYITAVQVHEQSYGLILCCQNKITSTNIYKLNKLLKSIIENFA